MGGSSLPESTQVPGRGGGYLGRSGLATGEHPGGWVSLPGRRRGAGGRPASQERVGWGVCSCFLFRGTFADLTHRKAVCSPKLRDYLSRKSEAISVFPFLFNFSFTF